MVKWRSPDTETGLMEPSTCLIHPSIALDSRAKVSKGTCGAYTHIPRCGNFRFCLMLLLFQVRIAKGMAMKSDVTHKEAPPLVFAPCSFWQRGRGEIYDNLKGHTNLCSPRLIYYRHSRVCDSTAPGGMVLQGSAKAVWDVGLAVGGGGEGYVL